MIIENAASATEAALAVMAKTPEPRLREIMQLLVKHSHAFVREAKLSDEEYEAALRFIVSLGQSTNDMKNEVVLAADVIGVSTLVTLLNKTTVHGQTAPALLGPFWRGNSPECSPGDNIARSNTPGVPLFVTGRIRNIEGKVVPGALVDVWQASPVGLYENQDAEQENMNLRGRFRADADGSFRFRTVRPAGYPVPTDGPIGDLLRAQERHPYRPAHIHFMVSAEDHRTLITQVFVDDDKYLETDVAFGVVRSLLGKFHKKEGKPAPDVSGEYYTLDYDFVLEPGEPTFPIPPIP